MIEREDEPQVPRIVVGVDRSAASLTALRWAADEARRCGGRLLVVHAWTSGAEHQTLHAPPASALPTPDESRVEAERTLAEAITEVLGSDPDVPVERRLVPGRPVEALLRQTKEADLLVIGSGTPLGGVGRLGVTVHECLVWASCPVVVVNRGYSSRAGAGKSCGPAEDARQTLPVR